MVNFAKKIEHLKPSPIREILKVIDRPGMISFAGGLPASSSFPDLGNIDIPTKALQYGPSEGDLPLRTLAADDLTRRGLPTTADKILILSGSQQGIDLVAKLLVDENSLVAVESPTYLAALQVFSLFGARYMPYSPNEPKSLANEETPVLTYSIPTFQNPTGHVYSRVERLNLAKACDASGTILFEDDPYRDLAFSDCDRQAVCSHIKKTPWIYQTSLSKTLAPGLRLGFLTCSPELFSPLLQLKQASDLHSSRVGQHLAHTFLASPAFESHTQANIAAYRRKRDHFHKCLVEYFSDLAEWDLPLGGLFFWLRLREQNQSQLRRQGQPVNDSKANLDRKIQDSKIQDTRKLLPLALEQNIAFMPGEFFYPTSIEASGTLRLNFSHASDQQTEQGLSTLAALVRGNT